MRYRLIIERAAAKQLDRLARIPEFPRLMAAIDALPDEPRPHGCKKLSAVPGYRIRVGDYRIVYDIDDTIRLVSVAKVGSRGGIYD